MVAEDHRPQFPQIIFYLACDALLAFTIAVQPRSLWRYVLFCLNTFICVSAFGYTSGDGLQNYSMGSAMAAQFFNSCHLILLTDPLNDFRHETDKQNPRDLPFWKRMYWALSVKYSARGIGWNYKMSNTPPSPPPERGAFIRRNLLRVLRCLLIIDLAQTYMHLNPVFSSQPPQPITSQGYILRWFNIVTYASIPYTMLNMQYSLVGAISVALGISEPRVWPDVYGKWRDAYTVRRLWSRTWHQLMRRYTVSIGQFVARALNLRPGSLQSNLCRLYAGFMLVTGVAHMAGDAMVGHQYLGATYFFFASQAVAITLEEVVIGLAKRVGLVPGVFFSRLIGYSWVVFWFGMSTPWFINWTVGAGLSESEILPFSPTLMLLKSYNYI